MAEWIRIERARWEELDETARRLARISTNQKSELDALSERVADARDILAGLLGSDISDSDARAIKAWLACAPAPTRSR
jgi:hypothetical protein